MEGTKNISLFWYRRDLRVTDNRGLFQALKEQEQVQPIFVFDTNILDNLEIKANRRVAFIHEQVKNLKDEFIRMGSDLWVFYGEPMEVFNSLIHKYTVQSIYTNHDYEPYATERDGKVEELCISKQVIFKSFKDQVIFEKSEVLKNDGLPYTVFTPYMKKWKSQLDAHCTIFYDVASIAKNLHQIHEKQRLLSLNEMGFLPVDHWVPVKEIPIEKIKNYHQTRDLLGVSGTSQLSVHLRFGTISIRQLVKIASRYNEVYLNELIWREFYMQILWHFPHVVARNFKKAYDTLLWNTNEADFEKWCSAKTGYPIVDAAMHQLLQTGFMHNRARMIVASFLSKHLLIDWKKGEAFFAKHLTDYELSSNNGGWQWAASTGCDAVPYFRIFNPYTQSDKFDKNGSYIKRWKGDQGLPPMISHIEARERCLQMYKQALNRK